MSSMCSVSAKFFFPMLVEMPYFGGVINPKTYFNHELGSNFFFWVVVIYISEPIGFQRILFYSNWAKTEIL